MGAVLAGGFGEIDVGGKRDVAGGFLPEEMESVGCAPEVGAGGGEGVSAGGGIVDSGAGRGDSADIGLAIKDAERRGRGLRACGEETEGNRAESQDGKATDTEMGHGFIGCLPHAGPE
jgi:hypothetical protein